MCICVLTGSTLGSAVADRGCSTSVAAGLTQQIVAQLRANGFAFPSLNGSADIALSVDCQPYLQAPPLAALHAATKLRGAGSVIALDSAFRSCAQQYLLYSWYQMGGGLCGIQIAAVPGTSNHEGGAAIDVPAFAAWRASLTAVGFQWYGADDEVHFDYTGGGGVLDLRAENLRAFQQLWNRYNPQKPIATDGVYGAQTAAALNAAPCAGWV